MRKLKKFKSKKIKDLRDLNKKSFSPIIAVILLVVVAVILVGVMLSWGTGITNQSLNKPDDVFKEDPTLTGYVYTSNPQSESYIVKNLSDKEIVITRYEIISSQDSDVLNVPITLDDPVNIDAGSIVSVPILCNPEKSFKVNLITSDGKYISVPINNTNYQLNSCINNTDIPDAVCLGISENGNGDSIDDPFVICSVADLNNIRNGLDKHYKLGRNLDLNVSPYNVGEGFEPIGNLGNEFYGTLDGGNYVINNLYINRPETDYVGLFGFIGYRLGRVTEIKNLILRDVNISGSTNVGSVVGNAALSEDSYFYNVHSSGSVSGEGIVGGLVGNNSRQYFFNSMGAGIRFSSFVGDVYCQTYSAGGLTGANLGYIENSYSNVSIVCLEYQIGGLSGYNRGHIENSYSEGEIISSDGSYIGGLVGYNHGKISNSYSFCNVIGGTYVGGLVGFNGAPNLPPLYLPAGNINNSYSAGHIIGNLYFGGLLGGGDTSIIDNIIYDTNTSGQSDTGKGIPTPTSEMKQQATFTNWNFTDIWAIDEGTSYPYLLTNPQIPHPISDPAEVIYIFADPESETEFEKSLEITLSSSGDSIYYTVDESIPNCLGSGTLYSSPITITEDTTLKAIGCKSGAIGIIRTFQYTLTVIKK